MGREVAVARREVAGGEGAAVGAVVGVMKPLTMMMMMTRGRSGGRLVGQQRGIHSVLLLLLKEGENGIIIDWPINQTNRGQRKWWRGNHKCSLGASWDVAMERPKSRPRPPT